MSTPIDRIEEDHDLPPSDDVRAGEYVLGVLDARSRLQAQARMASEPVFASLVQQWEHRFAAWMTRAEPVVPSPHVWLRIRNDLGWPAVASSRPGLWNSVGFWRATTTLAAAASVAAIVFGLRGPAPTSPPVPVPKPVVVQVTPQTEEAVARPVTVLAADDGATGWIATIDASNGKVLMVPVPRPNDASGKINELWVIPAGQAPISLGFVSNEKAHSIDVPAAVRTALVAGSTLAITLEPEQGLPHAAPTGPIVAAGAIVSI